MIEVADSMEARKVKKRDYFLKLDDDIQFTGW